MKVSLSPFPSSDGSPLSAVEVWVEREGEGLWLRFSAWGDVNAVEWPVDGSGERTDDLWRHTCFEAFVTTDEGYAEYNLSPSGQWATYRFDGYRKGMRMADETVKVEPLDGTSEMVAMEAWIELPPGATRVALSAVIEAKDGSKSYWALAHPSDKPDFHHPDSFVLDLP